MVGKSEQQVASAMLEARLEEMVFKCLPRCNTSSTERCCYRVRSIKNLNVETILGSCKTYVQKKVSQIPFASPFTLKCRLLSSGGSFLLIPIV